MGIADISALRGIIVMKQARLPQVSQSSRRSWTRHSSRYKGIKAAMDIINISDIIDTMVITDITVIKTVIEILGIKGTVSRDFSLPVFLN
jgi:hypothetical protein